MPYTQNDTGRQLPQRARIREMPLAFDNWRKDVHA
jgi:hypothetical protein